MSSFSYVDEDGKLYLVYKVDADETVNEDIVNTIINKKREGIAKTAYCTEEEAKCLKYDVSSRITLKELLTDVIDDKVYCNILSNVASIMDVLDREQITKAHLVLNEELIYYDRISKCIEFISIPTSNFVNQITSRQIIHEFSKLIISRMEVASSSVLEVNDYLAYGMFDFEKFNCLINRVITDTYGVKKVQLTKREYEEQVLDNSDLNIDSKMLSKLTVQPEVEAPMAEACMAEVPMSEMAMAETPLVGAPMSEVAMAETPMVGVPMAGAESTMSNTLNLKEITETAKKMIKNKVSDISKAIENIKNLKVNKEENNSVPIGINGTGAPLTGAVAYMPGYGNMPMGKETYQEAIRFEVAQQKEEDRKRMEDMKNNFDNNRIFGFSSSGVEGEGISHTVIKDCVEGSVSDGSMVNTIDPYLIRISTGEKIYINSNNFKLGRGRKFVDYYVGGNDTISKVHAYIINNSRDFFIVDNSSRNHTYLDGVELTPVVQMELKHKSKIRLAKEEFVFYLF